MHIKANLTSMFRLDGVAPDSIEYLPAGVHTVCCTVNGEPAEITIEVTEDTAKVLSDSLKKIQADFESGVISRPFIDFDHLGGRAAAIPTEIYWDDGVRLKLEWTPAGRSAIEGREYSYFSPEFLMDKETKSACGLPSPSAIGALVNIPAFQTIEKISAKQQQRKETDMSETDVEKKDARIKELEAALEEKNNENETLKASLEEQKQTVEKTETEKKQAEEKLEAMRKQSIQAQVDELVKAGRCKEDGKDALVAAALASSDNGKAIFDALPERIAGRKPVGGAGSETKVEGRNARDAIRKQFNN